MLSETLRILKKGSGQPVEGSNLSYPVDKFSAFAVLSCWKLLKSTLTLVPYLIKRSGVMECTTVE